MFGDLRCPDSAATLVLADSARGSDTSRGQESDYSCTINICVPECGQSQMGMTEFSPHRLQHGSSPYHMIITTLHLC